MSATVHVNVVRRLACHYISPTIADEVGLLDQLRRFVAGSFSPTKEQVEKLAKRMGLTR